MRLNVYVSFNYDFRIPEGKHTRKKLQLSSYDGGEMQLSRLPRENKVG